MFARDDSGGGTPGVSGAARTPTAASASTSPGAPTASASGAPTTTAGAPTTAGANDRWQGERDALGTYLVPPRSEGWSLSTGGETMAYADEKGTVLAKAQRPAYYQAGYCSTGAGVARAWAGFSPTPDGVVESSKAVATAWAGAIGHHADGRIDPHSPVISRTIDTHTPGVSATSSRTVVTLLERDTAGCLPPRVEITTVTARTAQDATTLVLVRDLDVAGQLSDDLRDRILASVRPSSA
ncbi:hypothetical protein [Luteipulveratus halotolerans]|uniref:DUF8017 domain-containing protein n=1 Tax=Luteipulveratus halotolerans TaxID=1631356 RepID=A0A0L6CEQ4_9MICO|nr:hypothetical protein [Luteipulveratus halotolerans]KNX36169.1 hypothetical protein VV01_01810 [Luteipulveratus halotolerans]